MGEKRKIAQERAKTRSAQTLLRLQLLRLPLLRLPLPRRQLSPLDLTLFANLSRLPCKKLLTGLTNTWLPASTPLIRKRPKVKKGPSRMVLNLPKNRKRLSAPFITEPSISLTDPSAKKRATYHSITNHILKIL